MRRGTRALNKATERFSNKKVNTKVQYYGDLGITLGGSQVVDVPGRDGFVFVRLRGNTSELIQALNPSVPSVYGIPVIVQRDGQNYKIVGRDVSVYSNQGTQVPGGVYPLPRHGGQHSFAPELGMGADVSWIFSKQFMPLLAYPSGSSMLLTVNPSFYEWNGSWRYSQSTGAANFAPYVPTITGSARMALLYIQPSDNSLQIAAGSPFSAEITALNTLATFIPDVDRDTSIPLAAVKLVTGTTAISWLDIYDLRDFYTVPKRWNGMGFQDDGVPLGTGTIINFGSNLSASLSNGVLTVNGSGGAGGGSAGVMIQDEGVPLGTGTVLNFVGANVVASVSGTVANIFITGSFVSIADIYDALQQLPRGTLINGMISPSISSGTLNLALKTWAGTDPSANDSAYIRIGNTVRTISSALSITIPTGTSYFNLGSAELRTKEVDMFAYLVWDSNSSVVAISTARYPAGNIVSDFSATTTNEKHLFNHANFTGTDDLEVIGRFAATLSATPFVWSVPTYTNKNLIQRPIYDTRWLDWTPAFAGLGSMFVAAVTVTLAKYRISLDEIRFETRMTSFLISGTPSAIIYETMPFSGVQGTNLILTGGMLGVDSSGAVAFGGCRLDGTSPERIAWIKDGAANWSSGVGSNLNTVGFYQA